MIKSSLLALALAASTMPVLAAPVPALHLEAATLPLTTQFDLKSAVTGSTYRIMVSQPVKPPPASGYPVMYVLDADLTFGTAATQTVLASLSDHTSVIIVGIGYAPVENAGALRVRDLTTAPPDANIAFVPPLGTTTYGGADAFRRFITQELRPAIAKRVPVNPAEQALMGYSMSGMFVLDALSKDPDAFRYYVVGSPALGWSRRQLREDEQRLATQFRASAEPPRIIITAEAPTCPQPLRSPCPPQEGRDASEIAKLYQHLDAIAPLAHRVTLVEFPDTSFIAGLSAAVSRAVAFFIEQQTTGARSTTPSDSNSHSKTH